MAGYFCGERDDARTTAWPETAYESSLSQQSRRHVYGCDGKSRAVAQRLGTRSVRRRLRQRRLRRSVRDVLREKCAVSQQRERNVYGRERKSASCRKRRLEYRMRVCGL